LEPPKPKVKISNLMRVLGEEATLDPTAIEQEASSAVPDVALICRAAVVDSPLLYEIGRCCCIVLWAADTTAQLQGSVVMQCWQGAGDMLVMTF
jgi:hypothetical protein